MHINKTDQMKRSSFFFLFLFSLQAFVAGQESPDNIRLNQIGFYPGSRKIAVIAGSAGGIYIIEHSKTGEMVYKGALSDLHKSLFSGKVTRIADFSNFDKPGSYRLYVQNAGLSYPFTITDYPYAELTKGLIKSFYYQRMSIPLLSEYAGKWNRKEGHPDKKVIIHPSAASPGRPEGTVISCPKGWYDAGDYNKYIVNSGITMGTLLSLYEDFPEFCNKLEIAVPEMGNDIPDLLDEILWNLRWMFTMQDPYDGGVYHKLTNAGFDGMIMPSDAAGPRYVVGKSAPAALDFAAVMAQAGRIFRKFSKSLPGLSDSCLSSASKAWKWAMVNPKVPYNQNANNLKFKPAVFTGEYGDNNFTDEFIWAASELYISTKDENYYRSVNLYPDTLMPLPSWGNVRLLGYYSLARNEKAFSAAVQKDIQVIKNRLIASAERMIKDVPERAYETVMGRTAREFVWGSNAVAANQGMLLIQVYRLTGDRKYLDNAMSNLDYLLGRNATGYSFVTGFGSKTPMHPHHRPSEADGIEDPIPGLLVGGPNPGRQDGCDYPSLLPDEAYVDSVCSYASNEVAINWNAPIIYLSGAIEALLNK
jgi:endoglucanase